MKINQRLSHFIDSFIPHTEPFQDQSIQRKSRIVIGVASIFVVLLCIGIAGDWLFGLTPRSTMLQHVNAIRFLGMAGFVGVLFSFRVTSSHVFPSLLLIGTLSFILGMMLLGSGGILSPGIFMLGTLPFLTTFLVGFRKGLLTTILLVLVGIALFIGYKQGFIPDQTGINHIPFHTLRMYIVFLVVSCGLMWLFESGRQRSIKELKESHQENLDLMVSRDLAYRANQTKSEFLATMSHELRTPLNAIIGYTEILSEDAELDGKIEYIEDLSKIKQAGKHLLDLINDILDLSKIEAGHMELFYERLPLPAFLQDLQQTVRVLMAKNNNEFLVEVDPRATHLDTDTKRIRQILLNLLSNAAKFTQQGRVTLRVAPHTHSSGKEFIRFEVIDTGIGMNDKQLASIFEKFTQADSSSTRKYGGTGLGLAISKELCEIMGGELTVESQKGKGTAFQLTLPLHAKRPPRQLTPSHDEFQAITTDDFTTISEADQPVALIIDDDPTVLDLLGRLLKEEGFQVVATSISQEALNIAQQLQPQLITLDVMMPVLGGWEVLKQIKADPILHRTPVIMITIVDEKEKGYAMGASEYINKPFSRDTLRQVFQKYQHSQPPKVLIVEDDEDTRYLAQKLLKREGWHTHTAENGIKALAKLESIGPDVILLDLMMPEMDGFQFLSRLRSHQNGTIKRTPVVVFTAKELTQKEKEQLSLDAERVLIKGGPTNIQKTTEQLRSTLRQFFPTEPPSS